MERNVYLFALSTCVHCSNIKKFLQEKGIEFEYIDVDKLEGEEREKVIAELKGFNPSLSFPTLVINGEKVVVGMKEKEIMEACAV